MEEKIEIERTQTETQDLNDSVYYSAGETESNVFIRSREENVERLSSQGESNSVVLNPPLLTPGGSTYASHAFASNKTLANLIVKLAGVLLVFATILLILYVIFKILGVSKCR